MSPRRVTLVVLLLFCAASTAPAEVFVLVGGGQIAGELLNPKESPRRQYEIQTADGAKVTLDAAAVEQILRPRPEEIEYQRIRPTYADTADAQWQLAEWCRERRLGDQREVHLRRVVELDPDHADARHALGYSQIDGQWATRDEIMTQRGYVKYKGQWKLRQEIELLAKKDELKSAQQEWFQNLKRWRGWLSDHREQQALENFHAIDNPAAVKALTVGLREDADPRVRMLYVDALARIDTTEAALALAIASISDSVEEVRLSCLDHLQKKTRPEVVAYFVGKLKDRDNKVVNRAAVCLGRMKDPSAVVPLIDALITVHKFKIAKPGGDNAMSSTFGTGPGGSGAPAGSGMSAGGGPKIIRQSFSNQAALDALIALTGQNFEFDKRDWKRWYSAQKKPPQSLDARRD